MIVTLAAFLVAIGVLIVVHEFGHFGVAKWFGVLVERFSVGFGPVVARRTVGETEYAISAIPLGGYVKMLGEDDPAEGAHDPRRSFATQSVSRRTAIVLAGPVMNLLLAFVIYTALLATVGMDVPSMQAEIGDVQAATPAAKAGLQAGDRVLAVDGHAVSSWNDLAERVRASGGHQVVLRVARDGAERDVAVTPELRENANPLAETPEDVYMIGIAMATERQRFGPLEAIWRGAEQTATASYLVGKGFALMLQGRVSFRELGGPIAIAQVAGKQARAGAEQFLGMLAFLSINLGILNLLPVPVLDGGQLALFAIEGALRRPLRPRAREAAQNVGELLLLALMAVVLFNDLSRLVQG